MARTKRKQRAPAQLQTGSRTSRRKNRRRARDRTVGPSKPMPGRAVSAMSPYAKLILDPCEAKLTSAPFPGRVGAQILRVPFRTIITVPTATVNMQGNSQTGGTACSAVVCSLFPHAMQSAGATPVVIQGIPSESTPTATNNANGGPGGFYYQYLYPGGTQQLFSISSEIRPVAACIKMGYIGPQGSNAGAFVAYEGQAAQLFGKMGTTSYPGGDITACLALQQTLSTLALDSWTTCDTTKTVEARVNFAAADPYWQLLKPTSTALPAAGAYVKGTGLIDSCSLSDPDLTGCPCASVAISGAVGGTQYLVSGAIVYEWAPSVTLGLPAPQRTLRDPQALQKVVSQVGKYGRMLVGLVADAGTGTAPGLMLDLAMKAFSSLAVSRAARPQPLRITSG